MAIDFKQAKLHNGLTIIAESDPNAHTSAIGFFVKTGARDEKSEVMGVSHFLEHMMFKGTESRSAEQVDQDFDNLGAQHNAFTSGEMTVFYAHMLPEHLGKAQEILSDIMRPSIRQADFDDEKSVIIEEIAMYEDHPFWVLYEKVMEAYFKTHPMGHRVLGTRQTVADLSRHQMQEYFMRRYSADNTVVALAGKMDFDDVVSQLTDQCGNWNSTQTVREYQAEDITASELTIDSEKVNRHYRLMLSPAPSLQDDRRYAASILTQILGGSDGSRLHWALIETGIAEDASAEYDGHDQLGQFLVHSVCNPEDAQKVEQIISQQQNNLADSLTDDDLLRVRSKIATNATLGGELPAGRMQRLGRLWTYYSEYWSLDEELARINAVTLDDLKQVNRDFPFEPCVAGQLRPSSPTPSLAGDAQRPS